MSHDSFYHGGANALKDIEIGLNRSVVLNHTSFTLSSDFTLDARSHTLTQSHFTIVENAHSDNPPFDRLNVARLATQA